MGFLDNLDLPDLDDARRLRPLKQKHETKTRAQEKAEKDKDDEAALAQWRSACRRRDRNRCRVCGRKVVVTLEHTTKRAECHHIEPRANKALRHDRRNGLTVHLGCHELLQRRELVIVQDKAHLFTLEPNGKHYWNADQPMEFRRPDELTAKERER